MPKILEQLRLQKDSQNASFFPVKYNDSSSARFFPSTPRCFMNLVSYAFSGMEEGRSCSRCQSRSFPAACGEDHGPDCPPAAHGGQSWSSMDICRADSQTAACGEAHGDQVGLTWNRLQPTERCPHWSRRREERWRSSREKALLYMGNYLFPMAAQGEELEESGVNLSLWRRGMGRRWGLFLILIVLLCYQLTKD